MCGINGLIGISDARGIIQFMNDALRHRGPDAEGIWQDERVALGHRRLSIIDLSADANQPFVKDGLVIVYNGEIYNYKELRRELEKTGVRFRTNSDTEVILELFRRDGRESFAKLLGMFAFCIYDTRGGEIFLVRDYFGIKPLLYAPIGNDKLAFSSELKSLLLVPGVQKEIDTQSLVSSLNYLWIPKERTIFKNIKKVPPAAYMRLWFDSGQMRQEVKKYWELNVRGRGLSEKQTIEVLGGLIEESVRRHLVADVEVGAFLSGGLDSSLISVLAKKSNPEMSTFTISLAGRDRKVEQMPDDNVYARKVAQKYGLNHHDIPLRPDIVRLLPEIVSVLDEPIGDPAAINTYLICKLAHSQGMKVLLSGMGADEIFAGYRRHYATLLAGGMPVGINKIGRGVSSCLPVRVGGMGLKPLRWAKRFFSFADLPLGQRYMRSYSYYDRRRLEALCGNRYDDEIAGMYDEHEELFFEREGFDAINRMCHTDIGMFMEGLNLTYTDRASMAHSVEVRVPFIDRDLVEFVMSIPGGYKMRNRQTKYILKKAAGDFLPAEIVWRPKASFGMPIRSWIWGDLKELIDERLSFDTIKKRGFLSPGVVRGMIESDRRGYADYAYQIYQFLTFEYWCRRYLDA